MLSPNRSHAPMRPTPSARPLILITNDDGIVSPGLHAAIRAVHDLGDLLVIAPSEQQSGMSRSLSPLFDGRIHAIDMEHDGRRYVGYHLAGSPAQAVLYGVIELAPRRPDLVISGVNYGENLGSNTGVSGTVGAALQGGAMGIRSLAISLETIKAYHYNHGHDVNWQVAVHWLRRFARLALAAAAWPDDVAALKIDIPEDANEHTTWRLTTQSRQPYYVSRPTARARPHDPLVLDYEVAVDIAGLEPESDIYAFHVDRVISVTPLSIDLTARNSFPALSVVLQGETPDPNVDP